MNPNAERTSAQGHAYRLIDDVEVQGQVVHTTAADYGGFTLNGGVLTGHGFHISIQGTGVSGLGLDDVAVV